LNRLYASSAITSLVVLILGVLINTCKGGPSKPARPEMQPQTTTTEEMAAGGGVDSNTDKATGGEDTYTNQGEESLVYCVNDSSDPDGDGWGEENNTRCKMPEKTPAPSPTVVSHDPDPLKRLTAAGASQVVEGNYTCTSVEGKTWYKGLTGIYWNSTEKYLWTCGLTVGNNILRGICANGVDLSGGEGNSRCQ
jgi:hypothetical protein